MLKQFLFLAVVTVACNEDKDCSEHQACFENDCIHNFNTSFTQHEMIGLAVLSALMLLANIIGEGGNVIFLPLAFLIFDFQTHEAMALANSTLFASTATRYLIFSTEKINYSLTAVLVPICLYGTFCGVMMGVVWPEAFITVVIDIMIICILILTLYRGMKVSRDE